MKVLDEKGKLFGLINIIDLAVLLIVVLLIAGGIWYINRDKPSDTVNMKDYIITIKCPAYGDDVLNAMNVGDKLYYAGGFIDAEIIEVRSEPAEIDVYTSDGRIVVQEHPKLMDIYVKVRVSDSLDDPMIFLGQLHATVGKDMVLKTRYVEIPAIITAVEE
ncbi:MAG: DUF4330 domain-containing protein [Bacillota bacterium]|jgi:hypothetical protein|nr:DUF4330 domain-containing protein [Bacillota bacterium]NLV63057.1 DUF4330 domain-containing protein [Clostridiaceae bacterium]